MAGCRALGWKHPALPHATSFSQQIKGPAAHRNKSSSFRGLAVWHENHLIFPLQVFDTHPVKFSLISHSGIAHQDDDIAEEVLCVLVPTAPSNCRQQLPFRFIIKPEAPPVFLHQLTFGAWAINFHSSAL